MKFRQPHKANVDMAGKILTWRENSAASQSKHAWNGPWNALSPHRIFSCRHDNVMTTRDKKDAQLGFCKKCLCECLLVHEGERTAFYSRSEFQMFSLISAGSLCWCPFAWAPTWHFHTVFCKFVWNILTDNSSTKYRTNPRLGQTEYLLIFYKIVIFLTFFTYATWMTCEEEDNILY